MHRPFISSRHAQAGNTLIVVMIFVAVFAAMLGAAFVFTDETSRQATRAARFVPIQQAADAAMDVIYGRFSRWVNAHTGLTPSITDAKTAGLPGDSSFPAITGAIDFSSLNGLSDYRVTSISLVPLMPDDTQGTDLPNWSTWAANPTAYQNVVNKYLINSANIYEPTIFTNAIVYLATVTITPTTVDSLHPGPLTVSRYIHASQVSPFAYNVFTEGAFEDYDFGQSFDSEASIYASQTIKMDHSGTIINGAMRYGTGFIDPTGTMNGTSNLVFQDPDTGATVDPYTSGLLKQVSKIEVVPDISDTISHNSDGSRTASMETATATADDFSRREIIEPPANLSGDTAPDGISQRRIYTQADTRLKVSVGTKTVGTGKNVSTVTVATGTFYNLDGSVLAQYQGTPSSATSTAWVMTQGSASANTLQTSIIAAVNVNPVNSNAPFYDPSRRYDTTSNYNGMSGQPTSANYGNAIESVDVNVGTLTTLINANASAFPNGIVYVWDDGSSGQKNGVRLWNGGVLPDEGLTVGSTNPIYIKGDFNTGTQLTNPSDINSSTKSNTLPYSDTDGWDNGNVGLPESERLASGYTQKPSGVFGDSITTLSQNWRDASSTSTQYATSTTFNTVMGFGSGDTNSLLSDDSFSTGKYSFVQSLEMWNNARWSQGGEQMSLYHSLYNRHRATPSWLNGGWVIIDNNYEPQTARLPLKWGYLVFSRGRYLRN